MARDAVNVLGLHLGPTRAPTVDAPYHLDGSLPTLDELPAGTLPRARRGRGRHGARAGLAIGPELSST
ncbi:hypothetical protein [Nonomuraea rubra]|uniref:hypothetical protein n=1 Tax=Nonomuraea rubra TaxID=46180 RepID=UPI0031EC8D68